VPARKRLGLGLDHHPDERLGAGRPHEHPSVEPERRLGPNARSFGHFGFGGSLGFADPDAGVAFAYVMNRSGPRWQNPRNGALVDALYGCL